MTTNPGGGVDLANFYRGMEPSFPAAPVAGASPCALLGAKGSGRSSMLFQYALQVALGGGRVVYVSSSEPSQQRRPLLPARLDEDEDAEEAFGRIGLKYISEMQDLQMYFASLVAPPDLLVIDTWTDILPPDTTPADCALKTMALLQNAIAPRDPPGDDALLGSDAPAAAAAAPETVCLLGGTDEGEGEVRWWQRCPLVLKLDADATAPHTVHMSVHKSRAGRHASQMFRQDFSTASGALALQ